MGRYFKYLKYVFLHKYFVFVACRKLGVSFWQAFVHDWSKFLPSEFIPYANYFYGFREAKTEKECQAFELAWLLHQRRNPHHWQYWYLMQDNDPDKPLLMPEKYAREMVADWHGAGRAITGRWDCSRWYNENKDRIRLHQETRALVEKLIKENEKYFYLLNFSSFEIYSVRDRNNDPK